CSDSGAESRHLLLVGFPDDSESPPYNWPAQLPPRAASSRTSAACRCWCSSPKSASLSNDAAPVVSAVAQTSEKSHSPPRSGWSRSPCASCATHPDIVAAALSDVGSATVEFPLRYCPAALQHWQ